MKENWLTQKPRYSGVAAVFILCLMVFLISGLDWFRNPELFAATGDVVFNQHQYYRLWTTLFVHADSGHLLSNLLFFIPLIYLLGSYFGSYFLPLVSIGVGGLVNAIVLQTLPAHVSLVGISGVVNWLGATWLALFFLIDRRENLRRRFAVVLFVTFVLFVPDTYKPEVSYLSHLVGYILGLLFAGFYYIVNESNFKKVEIFEIIDDEPVELFFETGETSQKNMSNLL